MPFVTKHYFLMWPEHKAVHEFDSHILNDLLFDKVCLMSFWNICIISLSRKRTTEKNGLCRLILVFCDAFEYVHGIEDMTLTYLHVDFAFFLSDHVKQVFLQKALCCNDILKIVYIQTLPLSVRSKV